MATVERISMSLDKDLCIRLDQMLRKSGAVNRSEFLRDLIRAQIVEEEWSNDEEAVGSITLAYDHHALGLSARLTEIQHNYCGLILASTHVHLDHDMCVEMILMRGRAGRLMEIVDRLRALKGVLHAQLSISTTGKQLKHPHGHNGCHGQKSQGQK